eukprot:49654_1
MKRRLPNVDYLSSFYETKQNLESAHKRQRIFAHPTSKNKLLRQHMYQFIENHNSNIDTQINDEITKLVNILRNVIIDNNIPKMQELVSHGILDEINNSINSYNNNDSNDMNEIKNVVTEILGCILQYNREECLLIISPFIKCKKFDINKFDKPILSDPYKIILFLHSNGYIDLTAAHAKLFHKCVQYGHYNTVKYCLDSNVQVNSCENRAIRDAARYGHLNVVKLLHSRGGNIHQYRDECLRKAARHGHINVLKYLIEVIGYKIQPQPQDNIAIRYMKYQNKRNKINWNILDYFFYDLKVDFKQKQNDYMTIIHEYSKNCKYFNCQEFEELIERYKLSDILWEKGQTDPTAASIFYEHRRLEIRPDIILCFKKLGYDICEPISNLTPIQHYCDLSDGHYINPKILQSFIIDGGAKLNYFIGRKQMNNNSIAQIITNSDAKIKYNKLLTLQMVMNEPFNIKLKNPNKRKQDIWYIFIQRFHSGHQVYTSFFEMFLKLMRIYINVNHEPIHLFHSNEIDENKKIKYKIYIVKDDQGYSQNDSQLKLKKNKKKLKNAKKFLNRIVFVTDDRDSVF